MAEPDGSAATPAEEELAARLMRALAAQRAPAALERMRFVNARCKIGIGAATLLVEVREGVPSATNEVPLLAECDFVVLGSARAWHALWQPVPAPGWHDVFALTKRGELRIEGNLQPFMANLEFFKALFAAPRALTA